MKCKVNRIMKIYHAKSYLHAIMLFLANLAVFLKKVFICFVYQCSVYTARGVYGDRKTIYYTEHNISLAAHISTICKKGSETNLHKLT